MTKSDIPQTASRAFADRAAEPKSSLAREIIDFLRVSKKWWLAPILLFLLLASLLILLGGTAAAPFIYTLF